MHESEAMMNESTAGGAGDHVPGVAAAHGHAPGASIESLQHTIREQTHTIEALQAEMNALQRALSHDLRAPLRAISGFSAMLREDAGDRLSAEWCQYLDHIHNAARTMSEQIDALLRLSEVSRRELVPERVDLSALVRKIHARFAARDPSRTVALHVADGLSATGDAHLLGILLEALLGNAWRFTTGVADARIQFSVRDYGGKREYRLRDNGVGFDMAYVDQLFVPFRRLHSQREAPGCGIGLALARRIVERHGGQVRAESKPGEGALFAFSLAPCEARH